MPPDIRLSVCALALSLAVPLSGPVTAAPPAAAEPVPVTKISPGTLDRGADIAVPHVRRRTIVDGDRRVTLNAPYVRLLGKAGGDYVVHVADADRTNPRILRVAPDGAKEKLLRGIDGFSVRLSTGGTRLASTHVKGGDQTVVKVWSAATGLLDVKKSFDGVVSILDFSGPALLLGGTGPSRTVRFDVEAVETDQVSNRHGYAASIAGDRLATYTRDPYAGGCTLVTKLSRPGVELWRSCRQRVELFSPAGRRMATVALMSDGVGPDFVRVHASRGRTLARYRIEGLFGQLRWEDDTRLLLDANGRRQFAVVRCDRAACERATGLSPAQSPKQPVQGPRTGRP
jgi:hypothetical protein